MVLGAAGVNLEYIDWQGRPRHRVSFDQAGRAST
jgi:hypothetical protein